MQKVVSLNTCFDVACLTFKSRHIAQPIPFDSFLTFPETHTDNPEAIKMKFGAKDTTLTKF